MTFENTISVLFQDKTLYRNILTNFREKANARGLTVEEHVLYNLIRGLPADRGFTPISNTNKLNYNVMGQPMYALKEAKRSLRSSIVSLEHLEKKLAEQKFENEEARREYVSVFIRGFSNAAAYNQMAQLMPGANVRAMIFEALKESLK